MKRKWYQSDWLCYLVLVLLCAGLGFLLARLTILVLG